MSKVTFRADEDLIRRVEALDASKSEVMREALRAYLDDGRASGDAREDAGETRVAGVGGVDVTISIEPTEERVEPANADARVRQQSAPPERNRHEGGRTRNGGRDRSCNQCGEELSNDHVYCPNCGEKAANRLFCDCGDEIRSDWAYCPSCGRRTPSADVLDG